MQPIRQPNWVERQKVILSLIEGIATDFIPLLKLSSFVPSVEPATLKESMYLEGEARVYYSFY
jgi:hypothetical protein